MMSLFEFLMIGPFGSNGKTGAATGLPGKPPRTIPTLWGHSGLLTASGRVAGAQIPALPGMAEVYLRNPSARTDGAIRRATGHGGTCRRTCAKGIWERCSRAEGGSGVSGLQILTTTTDLLVRARVTSTPNQAACGPAGAKPGSP